MCNDDRAIFGCATIRDDANARLPCRSARRAVSRDTRPRARRQAPRSARALYNQGQFRSRDQRLRWRWRSQPPRRASVRISSPRAPTSNATPRDSGPPTISSTRARSLRSGSIRSAAATRARRVHRRPRRDARSSTACSARPPRVLRADRCATRSTCRPATRASACSTGGRPRSIAKRSRDRRASGKAQLPADHAADAGRAAPRIRAAAPPPTGSPSPRAAQGDLQAAWDAAQAGWVRAPLAPDHGVGAARRYRSARAARDCPRSRARAPKARAQQPPDTLQAEWELDSRQRWNK